MNKQELAIKQTASVAMGIVIRYALYKKGYVKNFWFGLPSLKKHR